MNMLKCIAVAAAFFTLDASLSRTADAQCDPGLFVAEILQANARVGWVARTENAGGGYAEHWCLLRTFRNFGSRAGETAPTSFRTTSTPFAAAAFTDQCRREQGAYHLATVVVQRY